MSHSLRTQVACLASAERDLRLHKLARPARHFVEGQRECDPTYRLDEMVKESRAQMGETRWQQLQREWDDPDCEPWAEENAR